MLNEKLQELYEAKIRVYEEIIYRIKETNFDLLIEFEKEFKKIENIDRQIITDPELSKQQLMKIRL